MTSTATTPTRVFYEADADVARIQACNVAIVGYGSQGHAHAQNLRDSGVTVKVVLREGSKSAPKAQAAGFEVINIYEAAEWADVIMFTAPDTEIRKIYDQIAGDLRPGRSLAFAHGLNIHFEWITPPADVNVFMVAPKAPGHTVREQFADGKGVPMLVAVHQDPSGDTLELALSYAHAIGGTRAGVFQTTFQEETETDLFGEQTVLCGILVPTIQTAYEVLVEAGYSPEAAYFEVCHELKLITDLINREGPAGMAYSISDTAKWGMMKVGPIVVGKHLKLRLIRVLAAIQDGSFASAWRVEDEAGRPNYTRRLKRLQAHPIEKVGARLRAMMPFLGSQAKLSEVSGG